MKNIVTVLALFAIPAFVLGQGTAFTYQGRLQDGSSPATGVFDFRFTIHDALTGGSAVGGAVTNFATSVSNGLFAVTLDFGAGVFTGAERWLEIGVRTNNAISFATLAPRQPITSTPYAITAGTVTGPLSSSALSGVYSNAVAFSNAANQFAGTFLGNGAGLTNVNALMLGGLGPNAFWKLQGNNVAPGQFLGSTNDQPVDIRVNGQRALRLEPNTNGAPNVIAGAGVNFVSVSIIGATISGGGAESYFGSTSSNRVSADFGVIGGGAANTVEGGSSVVAGGFQNSIHTNSYNSVIGGGSGNIIEPGYGNSVIAGGFANAIQRDVFASAIGGGWVNTNGAGFALIGGGWKNTIQTNSAASVIDGGYLNTVRSNSWASSIGGGEGNLIQSFVNWGTIGGGRLNNIEVNNFSPTIAGGEKNSIRENVSFGYIGGGLLNEIQPGSGYSVVGGGYSNTVQTGAGFSVIAGGESNAVTAWRSVIGGGAQNRIEPFADLSVIGGGWLNHIHSADQSVIVGGNANHIFDGARESFVGGGFANTIQSNAAFSFIGAGTGHTIGSNSLWATVGGGDVNMIQPNASYATVAGGQGNVALTNSRYATIPGGVGNAAGAYSFAAGRRAKANHQGSFVWADSTNADFTTTASNQFLIRASGGVGIGTTNPTTALEVVGSVKASGFTDNGLGFSGNGGGLTNVNAATLGGLRSSNFWQLHGNNVAAGQFLGSTNNQAVEVRVNGGRALRLEPTASGAPNVIAGSSQNAVASGASGVAIGGGLMNMIGAGSTYATVGGGQLNVIDVDSHESTIGGGYRNEIHTFDSTIGGGASNTIETNSSYSTIGGGTANRILNGAQLSTIGGGVANVIETNAANSTISGGNNNRIALAALAGTIAGGENNRAGAPRTTVSGGADNTIANAPGAAIGGGMMNVIQDGAPFGTIAGGNSSRIEIGALASVIGGGQGNVVTENAIGSVIAGGTGNNIARDSSGSVIGGGTGNEIDIDTDSATIDGGEFNRIGDQARWSSVGGGYGNFIQSSARYGTIGGGRENNIGFADTATVAGGSNNFVGGAGGTVGGGQMNVSQGVAATVPGGQNNESIGDFSLAAGRRAKAIHPGSFVWADSTDADFGSAAADQFIVRATNGVGINTRSPGAMLQVGDANTPDSQGMIRFASHAGVGTANRYWDIGVPEDDFAVNGQFFSFVIDDPQLGMDPEVVVRWDTGNVGLGVNHPTSRLHVGSGGVRCEMGLDQRFSLGGNGSFEIDAPGIVAGRFVITDGGNAGIGTSNPQQRLHVVGNILASGSICANSGVNCVSDRNVKAGFEPVDPRGILEKVAALSITRWRYTNDTSTPHIGPVAQDFHAAFAVGANGKSISTVDADGVALAAIQGLNQKLAEELQRRDLENAELKSRLSALEELVTRLNQKGK